MCFAARRAPADSLASLALLILAALALQGCGQSSSRDEEYSKNNSKSQAQEPVGKFAGHVTVDGATQVGTDQLFVFLTDPQHLEKPMKYVASCNPEGHFEFMTYFPGDGVPLGKYVVGFVALRAAKKSTGAGPAGGPIPYRGPDGLKNLYNDTDKNKDIKEFLVEVTQPGRSDYEFTLSTAGKAEGVLGPHSVKSMASAPSDF
jgi:hypothetical protein